MEVTEDSLSHSYEYVDTLCLDDKNIILPEGCTTATITTEDGEAVTVILSQSVSDSGNESVKEIISENDNDIVLGVPSEGSDVDQNSAASNTDESKTVHALYFPSSCKSENFANISISDNQEGDINEPEIDAENASEEPDAGATNLEDFMDVVTTYKCKFCRFSCPWKSGLVSHIRCCHIHENKNHMVSGKNEKEPNIVTATKSDQQSHILNKNVSLNERYDNVDSSYNSQDNFDLNQDSIGKYSRSAESESDIEELSLRDAPVLERHVFLCGQCSEGFETLDDCKQHMIDDHNIKLDKKMIKPLNKRGRPRTFGAKTGVLKSEGKTKLQKRVSRLHTSDRRTVRRDGQAKPFKCPFHGCAQKFSSEEFLQYHYSCHISAGKTLVCHACKWEFDHWRVLVMHLWREHAIDIDLFPCPDCSYKTFSYFKLGNHRRIHSDERSFVCQYCTKGFKQISQLRNHLVTHMDRKNMPEKRWYSQQECEICGRKFSDTKCLRKHQQAVHSKLKPYVCSFCGHMSARKAMLELHMRQHTGEKPFQCEHCEYKTGDHNSLRRHRMRHTGAKPYKCPHCPYACIQAISYKTHLRNKHPGMEGLYSCTLCSFKSVSKENYVNHMGDHKREGLTIPDPSVTESGSLNFEVIPPETSAQIHLNDNALQQLEGILPGNITAAQLIYSCLNALSQEGGTVSLPPGVTVNLPPSATNTTDGTQTITIQLPTNQEIESEPYYFTIQPDENNLSLAIPEEQADDADDPDPVPNPEGSGDLENADFNDQDVSGGSMDCSVLPEEDDVPLEVSNEDSMVINTQVSEYNDSESFTAVVNVDDSKDES